MIRGLLLALVMLASPAKALDFFGYVAVMCDLDDPFEDSVLTDFSAEVAGFTNANHVCLPADPALWIARLQAADAQFRPILSIEGVFDFAGAGPGGPDAIWPVLRDAIRDASFFIWWMSRPCAELYRQWFRAPHRLFAPISRRPR